MECYYNKVFGSGMLASLFIFGAIFLFWDAVEILFKKAQRILREKINNCEELKRIGDK
jgi:hypothetical protein